MKSIEELIDDIIELAEEGVLYTPDYFKDKYKMDEQLSKIKDNKTALLAKFRELEQQVERLKCCANCKFDLTENCTNKDIWSTGQEKCNNWKERES